MAGIALIPATPSHAMRYKTKVQRPPSPPVNEPRGPFRGDGPARGTGSGKNGHRWRRAGALTREEWKSLDPNGFHRKRFLDKYVEGLGLKAHDNPMAYVCSKCFLVVGVNGPDLEDDLCINCQVRNMMEA